MVRSFSLPVLLKSEEGQKWLHSNLSGNPHEWRTFREKCDKSNIKRSKWICLIIISSRPAARNLPLFRTTQMEEWREKSVAIRVWGRILTRRRAVWNKGHVGKSKWLMAEVNFLLNVEVITEQLEGALYFKMIGWYGGFWMPFSQLVLMREKY